MMLIAISLVTIPTTLRAAPTQRRLAHSGRVHQLSVLQRIVTASTILTEAHSSAVEGTAAMHRRGRPLPPMNERSSSFRVVLLNGHTG
jgi:hypothetical protein